jgi:hypothetical protein
MTVAAEEGRKGKEEGKTGRRQMNLCPEAVPGVLFSSSPYGDSVTARTVELS